MLTMKVNTVKRPRELTTPNPSDTLKSSEDVDMVFSASLDLTEVCQRYEQVFWNSSPDPQKCYITGKAAEEAVVKEMSTVTLQVITIRESPAISP